MTSRSYSRLSVEDFGRVLLLSGDLDPVYVALRRCEWGEDQMRRWLLAYWLSYHAGFASFMSEGTGEDYWDRLEEAAWNETPAPVGGRWPRSPERRHWRGENATKSVHDLRMKYARPEGFVEYVLGLPPGSDTIPYTLVEGRVRDHYAWGKWIAFKVADMAERVLDVPVVFGFADVMYDSPRKGALRVWRTKAGVAPDARIKDERAAIQQVADWMTDHFKSFEAPPVGFSGRPVGLQEVETILCKWNSHMNGHYAPGHDVHEIRAGLAPWATVSSAAREFLHWMPPVDQPFLLESFSRVGVA
jgi:hypothetical protein